MKDTQRTATAATPGVAPGDDMSEAGRKILAFHLARMLKEEVGVRKGDDIEAVHDMRVATRRMRSVLRIFSPYYERRSVRSLVRRLRRVARALGEVRDLDVFRLKTEAYAARLSARSQSALQPLLDRLRAQEDAARAPLMKLLESKRYAEMASAFTDFVKKTGMDAKRPPEHAPIPPEPSRVAHVAPGLVYAQWGAVMAFAPYLSGASLDMLHALRIELKRLRYLLEAFAEVMGSEASIIIEATKALQDHLGDLQDSRVAVGLLDSYLDEFALDGKGADDGNSEGAATRTANAIRKYRDARLREQRELEAGAQTAFSAFSSAENRRALALAVAAL